DFRSAPRPEAVLRIGRPPLHHFQLSEAAATQIGQAAPAVSTRSRTDLQEIRTGRARVRRHAGARASAGCRAAEARPFSCVEGTKAGRVAASFRKLSQEHGAAIAL